MADQYPSGYGMAGPMHHPQQQQQQQSHPRPGRSSKGIVGGVGVVNAPSKVLHIRGLPPYTTESDLLAFFSSLPAAPTPGGGGATSAGGVLLTRILILPNSNQAFIQLSSIDAAASLLQHQAALGGSFVLKGAKSIIVQYSNRQEIHTPVAAGFGGVGGVSIPGVLSSVGSSGVAGLQSHQVGSGGPDSQQQANSILIITVLNTRVPVTLDHIHSICKPYGDVLKIITFHKNGVFKALVQLGTVESAVNARMMLEGKDIFQGCCHLRIGFSSLAELHVKSPGNNARDFTTPSGATNPHVHPTSYQQGEGYAMNAASVVQGQMQSGYVQQSGLINTSGYVGGGVAAAGYAPHPHHQDPTNYHHPAAHPAAHAHAHSLHAASAAHPHVPGCVVLVSNLPDTRVTCGVLFTLFGVYGDVQRVKILYQKRDTALIQYVSPQSAYLAALHLNHLHLYGKQISVTPSKHVEVSMPKSIPNGGTQQDQEQQLSGLTQDYTHSPIHRFKRSSGAASATSAGGGLGIHAKSIHPPSQVLHVSSLADAVTEDELRALFSSMSPPPPTAAAASTNGESTSSPIDHEEKISQTPPIVQFFTSTPKTHIGQPQPIKPSKQAFLRFESVAAAVENLIEFQSERLHARMVHMLGDCVVVNCFLILRLVLPLSLPLLLLRLLSSFSNYNLHGRYLRISFSGKDPAQVHETLLGQPIHTPATAINAGVNVNIGTTATLPNGTAQTTNDTAPTIAATPETDNTNTQQTTTTTTHAPAASSTQANGSSNGAEGQSAQPE